ncbi:MAG TPA: 2Fe-2S iron-sulfur cluster-binding protein [Anaerolineales bacterium]|nr:2Fe-2S iron-sulfur cluster-binding protein [Anaerolineales bacterium]
MTQAITLTIDDQTIQVAAGTTILQAARSLGIDIPTICVHEATKPNALCRTCVVEVEGMRVLAASCVAQVNEGMVVHTRSERVERSRKTILEMLAASVDLSEAPAIQTMMHEYQVDESRFPDAIRRNPPVMDDNPMYIRDYEKCVLCWRCVQVCAEDVQYTYAINFSGRGFETQIATFFNKPLPLSTCVFCGQCIGVCPTNALKPKREWLLEQGLSTDSIVTMTQSERRKRRRE